MKIFTSKNQQIGEIGEEEATKYLINKGFKIIERNYTRKWGELDIIAKKGSVLHFVEVKAITVRDIFSRENFYRPEDHMSPDKIKRLRRIIQTYLMEKVIGEDQVWQFDLACVYLRLKQTFSEVCSPKHPDGQNVLVEKELLKIEVLEDIIL